MRKFVRRSLLLGLTTLCFGTGSPAGDTQAPVPLQDGPAGYTIACAIHSPAGRPGIRACAALGAAQRCEHELDLPSQSSQDTTGMTFANRSDQAVKLYWLTFSGERRLFNTIVPGHRVIQETFIGHNWLVTTPSGHCVGIYNASPVSIAFF